MTTTRYLKVSPRGFADEVIYLKVAPHEADAAEALIESYAADTDGYAEWTFDRAASTPGISVDFPDKAMVGL